LRYILKLKSDKT